MFLENLSEEANSATSQVFMDSAPFGMLFFDRTGKTCGCNMNEGESG